MNFVRHGDFLKYIQLESENRMVRTLPKYFSGEHPTDLVTENSEDVYLQTCEQLVSAKVYSQD